MDLGPQAGGLLADCVVLQARGEIVERRFGQQQWCPADNVAEEELFVLGLESRPRFGHLG